MGVLVGTHASLGTAVSSVTTGAIDTTGANAFFVFVVISAARSFTANPISDNKGNAAASWVLIESEFSGFAKARMYYFQNAASGTGHTFTLTTTDATLGARQIIVLPLTGMATSGMLDQSGPFTADAAEPYLSTSETTTSANEVVVSAIVTNSSGTMVFSDTNSPTPWTTPTELQEQDGNAFWAAAVSYIVVSSTAAYQASWISDQADLGTDVGIATFIESAGGTYIPYRSIYPSILAQ